MAAPKAKKIKTEPDVKSEASGTSPEEILLEECRKHPLWIAPQDKPAMAPPKDYADYTLDGNKILEKYDKALLGGAIQKLMAKSRLVLHDHPKGGRCLRYVSEELAQQQVERCSQLTFYPILVVVFIHKVIYCLKLSFPRFGGLSTNEVCKIVPTHFCLHLSRNIFGIHTY